MTLQEKECVRKWNDELSNDVQIRLVTTEDKRSEQFRHFCDLLSHLAPRLRIVREEGEPNETPSIQLPAGLRYHAIPLDKELVPFLEALSVTHGESSRISASVRLELSKLDLPAALKLFISQQCTFCPLTVRQLVPVVTASDLLDLAIFDCTLFPEIAQSNKIQSVPTLLFDEQFRWTGTLRLEEVVEVITSCDPAKLSPSSLERMVKEGNASRVMEMLLDRGSIFPAFVDLLAHEKLFVRLGAMVIMEEIAEQRPELAAQVVGPLWDRFPDAPDQVKGDIVHVLGQSANDKIVPWMEEILRGPYHPEVKEAAKEALERICLPD